MKNTSKSARDNHANQLNPNNAAYWQSRGLPGVPAGATQPIQPPSPQPSNPAPQVQQPSPGSRK